MTKYDDLDPRTQLEQQITKDLKDAFEKRGFQIRHNGTTTSQSTGGLPDIDLWNEQIHINVEVTQTTKSSSDREMLSISDHLNKRKKEFSKKKCFTVYVSPSTHYRMINAIHDYNTARKTLDQKIIPICFPTFELIIQKLSTSHRDIYPIDQILTVFDRYYEFVDDDKILSIFFEQLFPNDFTLKKDIDDKEILQHAKLEQDLFGELEKIEDRLREFGIATGSEAIKNLIYLVFIKLFEEKKESRREGKNYFTVKTFNEFQQAHGQTKKKKAIHKLFEIIRNEEEFQKSELFTKSDHLAEGLDDDFVIKNVIEPLEKYHFYLKKVDGLGAAYEVLALRSSKDVKVGQFFTPKSVVQFMVKLAELETSDLVLDPACGTGRFLIWAMDDMIHKVSGKDSDKTTESIIRKQLFGTDNDPNVAKLAKMNMYIHDDGKSNIWSDDGLLLDKRGLDNKVDVILTNPPLGKINYRKYGEEFLKRIEVIPRTIEEPDEENENGEETITGNVMKGSALFVNVCKYYLKDKRDSDAKPEWRGGKLLIILDEGILNTDDYKKTRQFIRQNFYIKAIISLTNETFIPVSKTPTKTSILYAIKKDDSTAIQTEPIFYAHAARVGMDTKKRIAPNHLMNAEGKDILSEYQSFKSKILSCYNGLQFNRKRFESLGFTGGLIEKNQN